MLTYYSGGSILFIATVDILKLSLGYWEGGLSCFGKCPPLLDQSFVRPFIPQDALE